MAAALIALTMAVGWIGYVAVTAIVLAAHDPVHVLTWAIATPLVGVGEMLLSRLLDHLATTS